jgi:hypothetical protein
MSRPCTRRSVVEIPEDHRSRAICAGGAPSAPGAIEDIVPTMTAADPVTGTPWRRRRAGTPPPTPRSIR